MVSNQGQVPIPTWPQLMLKRRGKVTSQNPGRQSHIQSLFLQAVHRSLLCPSAIDTFSLCHVKQQDAWPLGKENSSPRHASNWHWPWSWYKHSKWLSTEQLCQRKVHVPQEHPRQNCVFSADGWGGQITGMQGAWKAVSPSGWARRNPWISVG